MRIALITREYPPETSWGGIGSFYYSFANSLKEAGCDVEVFTQGIFKPSSENQNGILVHRVLPRKWVVGGRAGGDLGGNSDLGIFALSLSLEMHRAFSSRHRKIRFDIVEGHDHLGINAFINFVHRGTVSTVTRYHTTYHSLVSRGLVNWPMSTIITYLERYSLRSASHRISTSEFIDKITQEDFKGIPPADEIIPLNIAITDSTRPAKERERLIVFVGRMMPGHKNPDMVARAFIAVADRFPQWRVEFAGIDIAISPEETMWQKCEKLLAPYKGRFKYHGFLPREKVNDLYGRARISVVPSKFESFGLVALESMAAGCVPIVADGTSLPEVVGDGGVTFKNGSLDDLIAKLEYVMPNEKMVMEKSAAGIHRVKENHSEPRIMKMNLDFYRRSIQKNNGGKKS